LTGFRFHEAAAVLYRFFWDEFCDWYIELAKVTLNDPAVDDASKDATRRTLLEMLEAALRTLHPIMPFLTEELWHKVASLIGIHGATIMTEAYPRLEDYPADPAAAAEIAWLKTVVLGVRRIRAESNLEPAKRIPLEVLGGSAEERTWLDDCSAAIRQLARVERIERVSEPTAGATTALAGETTLLVPLLDLIDPEVERERLTKELARLEQDLARVEAKLANESFVARAPAEVVDKERRRAADNADQIARLRQQLARLGGAV
jgi:valyl-tRNA synthetase